MTADAATGIGAVLFLFLIVPAIVLFVCWVILPFAVVGTKPLLRQIRDELRRSNELAERHLKAMERAAGPPAQANANRPTVSPP